MSILWSLVIVGGLILLPLAGVQWLGLSAFFGIVVPYAAILVFLVGAGAPRSPVGPSAGAVPHSDDMRAAALAAVDQGRAGSTTRRPGSEQSAACCSRC